MPLAVKVFAIGSVNGQAFRSRARGGSLALGDPVLFCLDCISSDIASEMHKKRRVKKC